jgi:hypothetical protein
VGRPGGAPHLRVPDLRVPKRVCARLELDELALAFEIHRRELLARGRHPDLAGERLLPGDVDRHRLQPHRAGAGGSRHDAAVADAAALAFDAQAEIYRDCIIDAQRSGEIDSEADAAALAEFFVAVSRGMEVIANAGVGRAKLTAVALTSLQAIPPGSG